jgi:non-heme chloroperoxidase
MRESLFLLLVLGLTSAWAQDPVQIDPKHYKVEYEDAKVRVIRFTLPPGESTPMHAHAERINVIVHGGTVRQTDRAGKVVETVGVAGQVSHRDPMSHSVTNIGSTVWETVSTEFKVPVGKLPLGAEIQQRVPGAHDEQRSSVEQMVQHPAAGLPIPLPEKQITPPPPPKPSGKETVASQLEVRVEPTSPIKGAKSVMVNGQELTYLDIGQGEPIVLVHDVATDLRNWAQQIDEFAKKYRVIAYSRRYHYPARATGKEGDYSFKQNVSDLLGLISQLNLGKVHAIGHAYGGAVVALAAMERPEVFRSVVLMEPAFDTLLPQRQATAAQYARDAMLSIVRREFLKRHNPEGAMRGYVDWSRGSGGWDVLTPDARQRFVENVQALAAYASHPESPEFECEQGKKLIMPVLVMRGVSSAPNYRIISSTLTECVPGAKSVSLPNASHWMHRENPTEFNKAVMDFVGSAK